MRDRMVFFGLAAVLFFAGGVLISLGQTTVGLIFCLAALSCFLLAEVANWVFRGTALITIAVSLGYVVSRFPPVGGDFGEALRIAFAMLLLVVAAVAFTLEQTGRRRGYRADQATRIEERKRLARDLHDSVKQQIFAVQASLATAQQRWDSDAAGSREAVEQARGAARDAFREMQTLLDQLQAEPLEVNGLVESLRRQAEALGLRTGAEVTVTIGELPANELLAPGSADALYRIAQEALANIGRHARASRVEVSLGVEALADKLYLRIQDDGAGFVLADAKGMGLANMKARSLEFGGRTSVKSRPGEGTQIVVEAPVRKMGYSRERAKWVVLTQLFAAVMYIWANWTEHREWTDWKMVVMNVTPAMLCLMVAANTAINWSRMPKELGK